MKAIVAAVTFVVGAFVGIYLGLYVFLYGGLVNILNATQNQAVDNHKLAWGVVELFISLGLMSVAVVFVGVIWFLLFTIGDDW